MFYGIYWLVRKGDTYIRKTFSNQLKNHQKSVQSDDEMLLQQSKHSPNNKKIFYRKWWFWIIVIVVIVSLIQCFTNTNNSSSPRTTENNLSENKTEDIKNNQASESENNDEPKVAYHYVEDVTIDRFITEFNDKSKYDITNISNGNIKTKYFGYANNCYIEMINANNAYAQTFSIKINGGQEVSDRDRMFEVLGETLKVLDSSLSDDIINKTINQFQNEKHIVNSYKISDDIIIVNYIPIVELSYGKTSCSVDIASYNYK